MEEFDQLRVMYAGKASLTVIFITEQARHIHQGQVVLDQDQKSGDDHIGEMRRFFQALRPGAAESFQYRSGDIVRPFTRIGKNVEGNDKIRASRIDVDQTLPDGLDR